jgi:hypothetical protein
MASNKIYNIQDWANVGSVSVPGASSSKIYPKVDGWYVMNSGGVESKLATSGDTSDIQNKYYIEPTEFVSVATYSQYLVYGDLKVDGILENFGQVVILNGTLDLTGGGTFSNSGTLLLKTLQTDSEKKYSATFSSTANTPFTITHNLNTYSFVHSFRSGLNIISAQVNIVDTNSITVTTTQNVTNVEINIIGI